MDKERFLASGLLEQYVLGLTSPEETREVEQYLAAYPELRKEADAMRKAIERYAMDHSIPPPAHLKSRITSQVDDLDPATRSALRPGPEAKRRRPWLAYASAGAALIFAMLSFQLYTRQQSKGYEHRQLVAEFAAYREECEQFRKQTAETTALYAFLRHGDTHTVELNGNLLAPDARVVVYWNPKEHSALLNVVNLPPLPTGEQYQIWADVEGEMINLGLVDTDSSRLQNLRFVDHAESLNITIEPRGGSLAPTVEKLCLSGKV